MAPLTGKVVIVTGASSGFGAAAARLFAREGCKVVLAARRLDRLDELAKDIRGAGGEALLCEADVSLLPQINQLVETTLKTYGQIDILYNNAGFGRLDWFENLDPLRDIEAQINANLLGVIQMARAVVPHMLKRGGGHIINIASIAAWIAAPMYSLYSASKYGVLGFSDGLRRDLLPFGVKVSVICPGPAKSEFGLHTGLKPSALQTSLKRIFPSMKSEAVAKRVVQVAKHPRRYTIFPWYYPIAIWIDFNAPWLVDWFVVEFQTRRTHKLEAQ
jgi:short-subunit dehydrogenase